MSDSGYSIPVLVQDIRRLEKQVSTKVSKREVDDVKADVNRLERKLDEIIHTQLANQRTAILQLVGIVVTLVVAGYGALT